MNKYELVVFAFQVADKKRSTVRTTVYQRARLPECPRFVMRLLLRVEQRIWCMWDGYDEMRNRRWVFERIEIYCDEYCKSYSRVWNVINVHVHVPSPSLYKDESQGSLEEQRTQVPSPEYGLRGAYTQLCNIFSKHWTMCNPIVSSLRRFELSGAA